MKQKRYSIILNIILILFGIAYQIFILKHALKYSESLSAAIILIVMFLSILFFGYRKETKSKTGKEIFIKTIFIVVSYFLIIYSLGFFVYFQKNIYSQNPILLLNNIFMPIVTIIAMEIYRYVNVSTRSRGEIYFTCFALIVFEVLTSLRIIHLASVAGCFKYSTTIILPIIIKNIYLMFLSKHGGLKSTIAYRILIDTYMLFVPIVPNFSDYMSSMFKICLPIFSYLFISKVVDNNRQVVSKKSKISILNVFLIIVFMTVLVLVSGVFTYTILGVGSNSMLPSIEKGDAVIIKKLKNDKEIKVGDIIAYQNKKRNRIIIHRLIEIKEENDETIYITKGDSNKKEDNIKITYSDIKGVVKLKIKYIARPSVYLNELLK